MLFVFYLFDLQSKAVSGIFEQRGVASHRVNLKDWLETALICDEVVTSCNNRYQKHVCFGRNIRTKKLEVHTRKSWNFSALRKLTAIIRKGETVRFTPLKSSKTPPFFSTEAKRRSCKWLKCKAFVITHKLVKLSAKLSVQPALNFAGG